MNVLLYGDSLLFPIRKMAKVALHNACMPGLTVSDALSDERKQLGLSMLLNEDRYDVLILCLGTNDLGKKEDAQNVLEGIISLTEAAATNKQNPRTVICGL